MGAMRLASEQQRARNDCVSGVGSSVHLSEAGPSIESLMTLLWATHCFDREMVRKLDIATNENRQGCGQLDGFRHVVREQEVELESGPKKGFGKWRLA